MSVLVVSKILRLFVNTFTPDDKYPLVNSENLTQPIQMQLSKKLKIFSELFTGFLKSTFNFQMQLSWKILGMFVDTLTPDNKYSLCNKDNLQQPIQMELCKKQKLLSQLPAASVKLTFNFQHFEKKDESDAACISEIIDREGRFYLNVPRFRTILDKSFVHHSGRILVGKSLS